MGPKKGTGEKGVIAEEALRSYFLEMGLFVVRGVPLSHGETLVTDIDLWLYSRPTTFTREVINVDIKRKNNPVAMQRIVWAKGLQQILGLSHCIVATTNKQPGVKEFGRKHGVSVLDGKFLDALISRYSKSENNRIDDAMIFRASRTDNKLKKWCNNALHAKSLLIKSLDFNGCNVWLSYVEFFIREILIAGKEKEFACRYLYLMVAYFLIGLDYVMQRAVFNHLPEKKEKLAEGLRYGESGSGQNNQIVNLVSKLISAKHNISESSIKSDIAKDFNSIPVEGLVEFFTKTEISSSLFGLSRSFESHAYNKEVIVPNQLPPDLKSIICVLLDFIGVNRKKFFSLFQQANQAELKL